MEVDILNDVLLRTVSNLFMNKNKHVSYFSEEDEDKQEIFPQQNINKNNQNNIKSNINSHNSNHLNNNNNQNEQPKKNLIEKIINNNINNAQKNNNKQNNQNNQNNQNQEITSPKIWCVTVGKRKYEEALHRLKIDERMIASKSLLNEMTLEQLTNEKARVKQELKKYDEDFYQVFKSKPTKENKEIMKPLYYYYQKLKLAISKKSNDQNSSVSETIVRNDMHNSNNTHINNNSNNQSIFPSTITYSESVLTQEASYSNNSELMSNPSESSRQSQHSTMINNNIYISTNNNTGNNKGNNNNNNYNVFHRKANSGGGVSSGSQMKIEDFNMSKNPQKRSLSKEEINALEQEYFTIKKEQNNLTQMLRNYQNEFQKTNNRKVKWTKDIKPVEKEYNKYKANKERIRQIKELFGHIENNNNK